MKSFFATFAVLLALSHVALAQTISNYQYVVSNQGPSAYFQLDGTLTDAVGPGLELSYYIEGQGGFQSDAFRNPTSSYAFTLQSDYLYYDINTYGTNLLSGGGETNTTSTAGGSITLLFRTLDTITNSGQRFLFSAGNTTSNGNALGLFFENNTATTDTNALKLRFGDTTTTILQASNIAPRTWYYFALTYKEDRVPDKAIWYLGQVRDTLQSGVTDNSAEAVAGEGGSLAIGNKLDFQSGFRNLGIGRIDEFAVWHRELSATEINDQFANLPQPLPPGATYQQVVESQIPKYYFKLDGSLIESVGSTLVLSSNGLGGAFTTDLLGNMDWAYSFSESDDALYTTSDLINGGGPAADTTATGVGSISLQFRMLSDTNNAGQRYILSQGGIAGTAGGPGRNQLALFIENTNVSNGDPNSLKLRLGNGPTTTIAPSTALIPGAWYYFAMTYDEARNTPEVYWYLGPAGGNLSSGSVNIANEGVIGDNGWIALGNRTVSNSIVNSAFSGPDSGVVDEFAIWHEELSPAEIQAQFDAVLNAAAAPPALGIVLSGSDVLLKWPSPTPPEYELETAPTITSFTWTNAGAPVVVGSDYVVTNAIAPGEKFYRLRKL